MERAAARTIVMIFGVLFAAPLSVVGCGEHDAATVEATAPGAGQAGEAAEAAEEELEPAPDFDLPLLGGGRVRLADVAGRIVIIDFWATWCPPCEFQVPELNAFYEDHRDEPDLALFGVSVDTAGADVVAEWVAEKGVEYPILLDGEPLARQIGALGFPTLLVITADGRVDGQHVGLIERATLEEALARLRGAARDQTPGSVTPSVSLPPPS